jgi:anaphase-promoting complex subunit 10
MEPLTTNPTSALEDLSSSLSSTEDDEALLEPSNPPQFPSPSTPSTTQLTPPAAHIVKEPSLSHLREISPLASWTVSTYKPGCGVPALLSPSTSSFWQSDGPQPHLLNIHFFKLVAIVKMRVYLDFELDESYTPTKMVFAAGMGEYDLVEFAEWKGEGPRGWVEIGLDGCGCEGESVLRCMCVQVRVLENHQNGKDTHIRGVQIFARDERVRRGEGDGEEEGEEAGRGLLEPEWMGEPDLR